MKTNEIKETEFQTKVTDFVEYCVGYNKEVKVLVLMKDVSGQSVCLSNSVEPVDAAEMLYRVYVAISSMLLSQMEEAKKGEIH